MHRVLVALAFVCGCSREATVTRDPAPDVAVAPPAPPKRASELKTTKAIVRGKITDADALLAKAQPLFRSCIEPGVVGEIELALTAGADGTVASRKILHSTTKAPEFDVCISGVAAMLKFNAPGDVSFTVTVGSI